MLSTHTHTHTGKLESSPKPKLGSSGLNSAFPHPVACSCPHSYWLTWGQEPGSALTIVPLAGVLWQAQLWHFRQATAFVGFKGVSEASWQICGVTFKACVTAETRVPTLVDGYKQTP